MTVQIPTARCVIGRETMIKLPRRVARALPSFTIYRPVLIPRTTLVARLANDRYSRTASSRIRTRLTTHGAASLPSHIHSSARTMSSDAEYAAFLDKANEDVKPAAQQDVSKKDYGTKSVNTAVPKALESVEEYYVSDADEPFEPVALEFDGSSVSASMYNTCLMASRANIH
jgi:hypothetical protein